MNQVRNWWSHSKTVALIWFLSFSIFYTLFHMALRNAPSSPGFAIANAEQRSRLYDKMARDLDERGAAFLKNGETSQSLSLSDLFTLKDGAVTPVLKVANPPVRANILYLSTEYSVPVSEAVKKVFGPSFTEAIWFQNSSLYHFSMFHASHHITPVPATEDEIKDEVDAVRVAAEGFCPLEIVLDRVILTSTGVLLGCWQVISGTDPIAIRSKLRAVLPRAPEKQLYDAAILHTSFARILGHPKLLWYSISFKESHNTQAQLDLFHKLVADLNDKIRGYKARVSELWFGEEYDVLALALNGRMKVHRFPLGCPKP